MVIPARVVNDSKVQHNFFFFLGGEEKKVNWANLSIVTRMDSRITRAWYL